MDLEKRRQILLTTELLNSRVKQFNLSGASKFNDGEIFALGAQLLYLGQSLTELSNFKLEPATVESREILAKIVEGLNTNTILISSKIGEHITEPIALGTEVSHE